MGILELLTVLFIVLKLVGIISWSWWLVLLPVIIAISGYLIVFLIWVLLLVIGVVVALSE